MSQPARPTRLNRNATFAFAVPIRRSDAMARIAPAPAQTPSIAATIGCGAARIAFTASPVMRVNFRSPAVSISTSGPMISNTSPPEQKLPPAPVRTNALTSLVLRRRAEDIRDLVVAFEGERILFLRPVERQRRDLAGDLEPHMARLVLRERQRHRIGCDHRASPPCFARARRRLGLGKQPHQLVDLVARKFSENLRDPAFMRARHGAEGSCVPRP